GPRARWRSCGFPGFRAPGLFRAPSVSMRRRRQSRLVSCVRASRNMDSIRDWPAHLARRLWQRQQDTEIRQSRPAFALDHPQVLLHEGLRQRQPEAAPAVAPGYERIENAVADIGRDARSIVDDMQV